MNTKRCLFIALTLLFAGEVQSQNTPVNGAFPRQVEWFDYVSGVWAPTHTVINTYSYVNDFLVISWEEHRVLNQPSIRIGYEWKYDRMPLNTQVLYQNWNGTGWDDVMRYQYDWYVKDDQHAYTSGFRSQSYLNKQWVTQSGMSTQQEFNTLGQVIREIHALYNPATGLYDPFSRYRYSYDLYKHKTTDTIEYYSELQHDWEFLTKNEYFYPQNKDSLLADSLKSYHWVPAGEVWALSWWKPDFRYKYFHLPRKSLTETDYWDDIGIPTLLHWDTLSRQIYQFDEKWNMTLNTNEKWKDEHWQNGKWKMILGQKWDISWIDTLPVERVFTEWVPATDSTEGFWITRTKEKFSDFFPTGIPGNLDISLNISVYPNPFTDRFKVDFPDDYRERALIQILDTGGRIIRQTSKPAGVRSVTLGNDLPSGPLILRILTPGGDSHTVRLLKMAK